MPNESPSSSSESGSDVEEPSAADSQDQAGTSNAQQGMETSDIPGQSLPDQDNLLDTRDIILVEVGENEPEWQAVLDIVDDAQPYPAVVDINTGIDPMPDAISEVPAERTESEQEPPTDQNVEDMAVTGRVEEENNNVSLNCNFGDRRNLFFRR